MITSELVTYIKQSLAQGATEDQIRAVLGAQGWEPADIAAALNMASAAPAPLPVPSPATVQPMASGTGPMESIQQPGHASQGLQQRFPLSSRKFWKKMIGTVIGSIFILLVLAIFGGILDQVFSLTIPILFWAVGVLFINFVCRALYIQAYIRRYYYDANDSFVTIKKGVFAPAEIHVQYAKIQDVYVDQDILDRIMGLYDVHIASATMASSMEAHIDGVDATAAQGLKDFLLSKLRSGGSSTASSSTGIQNPVAPTAAPITFSGDISSTTYPIAGTWLVQQALVWIFTSALYAIIVDIWLVLPGKDGANSVAVDFNLGGGTFWGVGLTVFFFFYLVHITYSIFWRSTFSFAFLPDYVVTKQGIFAKSETHLPYRSVQDVTISQSIIERLFGLATVRIENAAQMVGAKGQRVSSGLKLPGQPFSKANEISDAIKRVALSHSSAATGL